MKWFYLFWLAVGIGAILAVRMRQLIKRGDIPEPSPIIVLVSLLILMIGFLMASVFYPLPRWLFLLIGFYIGNWVTYLALER